MNDEWLNVSETVWESYLTVFCGLKHRYASFYANLGWANEYFIAQSLSVETWQE